jgi:predicted membrane metal-binding protein
MAFFIAHFCLGVVLTRFGLGPQIQIIKYVVYSSYVLGVLALISACKGWVRLRAIFFSLAGISWGISHSGQTILQKPLEGRVVMVAATSNVRGPLLMVSEDGAVFETFGPQNLGMLGTLKSHPGDGLFNAKRLMFSPTFRPGFQTLTWWQRLQETFREWLGKSIRHLSAVDRVLVSGIVFGEQGSLPKIIEDSFKNTGLYHLLVVSGLHVSLMATMFSFVLRAPVQLGYSLRFISPRVWGQFSAFLRVSAAVGAMTYLSLTGASAAAQRSALFFAVRQVSLVFFGDIPIIFHLLLTAMVQIMIFPLGFLSEGTCMSWVAYLVVANPVMGVSSSIRQSCRSLLTLQVELMVLVTAIFGQLVVIGLVTNLLFVSVFPVVLFSCLIAILAPWPDLTRLVLEVPHNYLKLVDIFDCLTKLWPLLSIPRDQLPSSIRGFFLILSVGVVLNAFKRLSISQIGGSKHGGQTLEWAKNPHH